MDQKTSQPGKMTARNKSAIFLGITAVAAIVVGAIIYSQATTPQIDDTQSPALTVSKQRAKAQTPTNKKIPAKTTTSGSK